MRGVSQCFFCLTRWPTGGLWAQCNWQKRSRSFVWETTAMAIRMYDLAGEDTARRFSPFCWRIRMALAHKGLTVETIPWRFTEKAAIAHSGQERVPVIEDGGRVLADSWKIANYLEEAYPDRTSLFGGAAGEAMARFFNNLGRSRADTKHCELRRSRYPGCHLHPRDRDYFRQTREKRFGKSLDDFCAAIVKNASRVFGNPGASTSDATSATVLRRRGTPLPRLHCVRRLSMGQSNKLIRIARKCDPIAKWRERMTLDTFDGLARKSPAY